MDAIILGFIIFLLISSIGLHLYNRLTDPLKGFMFLEIESYIKSTNRCKLHGIPDLICKARDKYNHKDYIVVVDIKNRRNYRYYESDKVQLSVYAYILNVNGFYNIPVSRYGYVLIKKTQNSKGKLIKIKLYNKFKVEKLYYDYLDVMEEKYKAELHNGVLCDYCHYNKICH